MENIGNASLAFLGEYVLFHCFVERSSCFQVYCFLIVSNRQYVLDDDRKCLFQTEQRAQRNLRIKITIPSLFLQTFLAVFSTSPIYFLLINDLYTIIFIVIDAIKVKHFFIGKRILIVSSFRNFFLFQWVDFFP